MHSQAPMKMSLGQCDRVLEKVLMWESPFCGVRDRPALIGWLHFFSVSWGGFEGNDISCLVTWSRVAALLFQTSLSFAQSSLTPKDLFRFLHSSCSHDRYVQPMEIIYIFLTLRGFFLSSIPLTAILLSSDPSSVLHQNFPKACFVFCP